MRTLIREERAYKRFLFGGESDKNDDKSMDFDILYKFVDSLKWVVATVWLVVYFRHELRSILKNGFSISDGKRTIATLPPEQDAPKGEDNKDIEEIAENKTKEELQELYRDNENKDNEIFRLKIEKSFEYTYRIIFKSQIVLLYKLQAINDGLSQLQVESYLIGVMNEFPALANSTIQQYLKFLFDQNLIERDNATNRVKLNPIGDLFLGYIEVNQYNYEVEKLL